MEISADQYPYVASSTGLVQTLPPWAHDGGNPKLVERLQDRATRARLRQDIVAPNPSWENRYQSAGTWDNIQIASVRQADDKKYEGLRVSRAAKLAGKDPFDFVFDLLIMAADLVIFDPDTVADRATFTDPFHCPVGIETVIVNGTVVLDKGQHTGARPGVVIYGPGKTTS